MTQLKSSIEPGDPSNARQVRLKSRHSMLATNEMTGFNWHSRYVETAKNYTMFITIEETGSQPIIP